MRLLLWIVVAVVVVGLVDCRGKNRGGGGGSSRGKYGGGGRQQSRNPSYERERERNREREKQKDTFAAREAASESRTGSSFGKASAPQAKPAPAWPVLKPSAPAHKPDPSKIGWNVPPGQTQHRGMPQPGMQHNAYQGANPPPYNPTFGQQKPPYPQAGQGLPQPGGFPQAGQPAGFPQAKSPYPQQPAGFPQQPGGFPQQPGGFPQQPGGFPQQPGGFPQQSGGFPPQSYPQAFPNQPHYHAPAGYPSQGMFGSNPGFGSPMGMGGGFPGQYQQNRGGLGVGGALAAGLGAGVLGGVAGAVGADLVRSRFNNNNDRDRMPPPAPGATPAPDAIGALPPAVNATGNGTEEANTEMPPGFSTETPFTGQPNPYYNQNPYYNPYYPNPYYQPQGTWVNGTFIPYVQPNPYQLGPGGQPIAFPVNPVVPTGTDVVNSAAPPQPIASLGVTNGSPEASSSTSPSVTTTTAPQKEEATTSQPTSTTMIVETVPTTTVKA